MIQCSIHFEIIKLVISYLPFTKIKLLRPLVVVQKGIWESWNEKQKKSKIDSKVEMNVTQSTCHTACFFSITRLKQY